MKSAKYMKNHPPDPTQPIVKSGIDFSKLLQTKDGCRVEIYNIERRHGAIAKQDYYEGEVWLPVQWNPDGSCVGGSEAMGVAYVSNKIKRAKCVKTFYGLSGGNRIGEGYEINLLQDGTAENFLTPLKPELYPEYFEIYEIEACEQQKVQPHYCIDEPTKESE